MSELRIRSMPEQIAAHLREELGHGRWSGTMPGRIELARQLGVGITSMEEALRQLERDGVLAPQGAGRMRRILLLVRSDRRLPVPGTPERAFLAELAAHGIPPGPYHLPDWKDGIVGYQGRLERLFHVTQPTASIMDEMMLFVATQQFLARKRLRVPEEFSLVVLESDPGFEWCRPLVAHVRWNHPPVMRRVLAWANHIAHGKKDRRESHTRAQFIAGGTIGPART
jgi:DNA-binding LacI/PurR family transcriptional regulator